MTMMKPSDTTQSYAVPLLTTEDPDGPPLIVHRLYTDAKVVAVMFPAVRAAEPTILALDAPKFVRAGDRFVMRVPPPFIELALATKETFLLTEEWNSTPQTGCPTCHAPPRRTSLPGKGVERASVVRSQNGTTTILAPGEMLTIQHDGIVGQVIGVTFAGEALCAACHGTPPAPAPRKRATKCAACNGVAPTDTATVVMYSLRVGKDECFGSSDLPAIAVAPGMIRTEYAHPGMLVLIGVRNTSKNAVRIAGEVHVEGPALEPDWDLPYTVAKSGNTAVGRRGGLVDMYPTASEPQARSYRSDAHVVFRAPS